MRFNGILASALTVGMLFLAGGPAEAGLFDSKPETPAVSAETLAQIQNAIDDQRYLDAGKMLDESMLAGNDNPKLVYLAGELALARNRAQDALSFFRGIDSKPEVAAEALQGEGIALSLLGKSDEALTALQSAVTKDATLWRAWNALGSEYDRRHDWSKAEDAYNHALAASNSAPIVLNNRGFSYLCQNKPALAIPDFVKALQKRPDLAAARNNLRLAIAMEGQYDRAMEGVHGADQAAVLNNVGYAALLRGDYAKAQALFDQAIKVRGKYYGLAADNLQMAQEMANKHSGSAGRDLSADGR